METSLYIQSLLTKWSGALGCSLRLCETPSGSLPSTPVEFDSWTLGFLELSAGEIPENELEKLAGQIAPLTQLPEDFAQKLDPFIEELAQLNPKFDWTGIYRLKNRKLFLTCFRGNPSPHQVIPLNQGICGAAVSENQKVNIEDVSQDDRYLSCDYRTKSELVVPIRNTRGNAIGEIDIDSHEVAAFGETEEALLERWALKFGPILEPLYEQEN